MTQHKCDEYDGAYNPVWIRENGLFFRDEYWYEINYCPYCGKSKEEFQ